MPMSCLMRRAGLAALALLLPLSAAMAASARTFTVGPITILQSWARATPGGAKVAAAYLTIKNAGDVADRLVAIATDAAGHAAPHEMTMKDGVMSMRALPDGIPIPAHATVTLKPGGIHLMLEDLKHTLKLGDSFSGTLTFAKAGTVEVEFSVEGIGAQAPAAAPAAMDPAMKMD